MRLPLEDRATTNKNSNFGQGAHLAYFGGVHPRLFKLSAPLIFLALIGLASEVRADGRVRQLVRKLTAKVQGTLKSKVTRRQFLGIDAMRQATKGVRSAVAELKAEQALMPAAIETATATKSAKTSHRPVAKKKATTSTGPDLGRRRVLGLIGAGLVVAAMPKPVQALELNGTKEFFAGLFGKKAQASEPPRQKAPARKADKVTQPKDRGNVVAPLAITGATYIRSGYKTRSRPNHRGIDIASPAGTKIRAATDGVVLFSGWNGTKSTGYGRTVVIWREGGGIKTVYGHMASWNVKVGQRVRAGDVIGTVGNSGGVRGKNGYHLHFEWHENAPKTAQTRDGRDVNPMPHVYP